MQFPPVGSIIRVAIDPGKNSTLIPAEAIGAEPAVLG